MSPLALSRSASALVYHSCVVTFESLRTCSTPVKSVRALVMSPARSVTWALVRPMAMSLIVHCVMIPSSHSSAVCLPWGMFSDMVRAFPRRVLRALWGERFAPMVGNQLGVYRNARLCGLCRRCGAAG